MWKRVPFGRSASEPSFERSEPPGLIRGRPNRSNAKAGTGALAVPAGTARRVRLSRSRRTRTPDSKVGGFYAHTPPASRTAALAGPGPNLALKVDVYRNWRVNGPEYGRSGGAWEEERAAEARRAGTGNVKDRKAGWKLQSGLTIIITRAKRAGTKGRLRLYFCIENGENPL